MARFALHSIRGIRHTGAAIAAVVGLGALAVGCAPSASARFGNAASDPSAAPMSVACEPNQRAVVRQVVVNGALQAQASCESVVPGAVGMTGIGAAPVAYAPAAVPVSYAYSQAPIENTRFVRTVAQPDVVTREVAPQRVVYQRAPERRVISRPRRSVQKSAIIIGSSAAGGAGIGALIGGKKGAGIGALAGGGAAAIWDQITRHKQ